MNNYLTPGNPCEADPEGVAREKINKWVLLRGLFPEASPLEGGVCMCSRDVAAARP